MRWALLVFALIAGPSIAEEARECSDIARWDERAYCENDTLKHIRSEISQTFVRINESPELAEPISNDMPRWSSNLLNICDDIACLERHHYLKLSRLRHDLLVYQRASLIREAFSRIILGRVPDDVKYASGPTYEYVQIPLHSMSSARYWELFRENPIRAYSQVKDKPVHIFGEIRRIRLDGGNPVFELYGSQHYRVYAMLSVADKSIRYGMDKSVGDSASLVCAARPPVSSRPELSQCIPHAEHVASLILELIGGVEDPDIGYGFVASSRPSAETASPGIHGVARIYSSSLYGVANIPLCQMAVTPECLAAIKESERNGDMDGWVRRHFYFQET